MDALLYVCKNLPEPMPAIPDTEGFWDLGLKELCLVENCDLSKSSLRESINLSKPGLNESICSLVKTVSGSLDSPLVSSEVFGPKEDLSPDDFFPEDFFPEDFSPKTEVSDLELEPDGVKVKNLCKQSADI